MRLHGLGEMGLVTRFCGFHLVFGAYKCGERDSGYFSPVDRGKRSDFPYELIAILSWHTYIADYDIRLMVPYARQPFVALAAQTTSASCVVSTS